MESQVQKKSAAELLTKKGLTIAGPCSAETEEQLVETSILLAKTGRVDMLRAGIWKPRTRPGSFEGIGTKGLSWMQKAKEETGLPVAIEVATAKQVEDALHFDVDLLWVGARTTVNPFAVQALAEALRGSDVPVLVKNPINPDVELWLGAIERLAAVGVKHLGLIHRGFSSFGKSEYRNVPMWHLPIEIKRRLPELPMICDPSHICGRRDTLQAVSQKALNLNYDGLMIESHINPDEAWSDAKQQVTPAVLEKLLSELQWRHEGADEVAVVSSLEGFREEIDHIDDELLQLLSNRMAVAENIGKYKKDNNISILQNKRWTEILNMAIAKGAKVGLSAEFIEKYLSAVHLESINRQNKVMGDDAE